MGKWKVWLLIALGILGRLVAWALLGRNESGSMERQSPNQSLEPTLVNKETRQGRWPMR